MSISSTDIRVYRAAVMDDSASNGGRQSWVEAVSGAPNNVWPDVTETQRLAGFDWYRKTFFRAQDAGNQTASNVRLTYAAPTPADDAIYAFPGTMEDTQGDLTGSERLYGCGYLNADVSAGATSLDVLLEDPTRTIFADGDLILIDDGTNRNWLNVSGTPTFNGSVLTITTATQILNDFTTAANTVVSSVIEAGDVSASISDVVETTVSGTFDENVVVAQNIGSEDDAITLTFTSATAFTAVGTNLGSLGAGNISSQFAPNNPSSPGPASPLFTIPASAWGGTWQAGETVTFDLNPPAVAIWERRIGSPGVAGAANNDRTLTYDYE